MGLELCAPSVVFGPKGMFFIEMFYPVLIIWIRVVLMICDYCPNESFKLSRVDSTGVSIVIGFCFQRMSLYALRFGDILYKRLL